METKHSGGWVMTSIRCSALPSLSQCSKPLDLVDATGFISVDEWNEAGPTGSAGHEAMRAIAQGRDPDLTTLAEKWGIADRVSDLEFCVGRGRALWRELSAHFPDPQFEEQFEAEPYTGVWFTGTIDVFSVLSDEVIGLDWKFSGTERATYIHQVYGYAVLLMLSFGVRRVTFILAYPRLGTWRSEVFIAGEDARKSPDELNVEAWLKDEVLGQMIRNRGTYRPGPVCDWCRYRTGCEGRREMVRSDVADFSKAGETIDAIVSALLDPEKRAEEGPRIYGLFEKAKAIRSVCERLEKAVHESVKTHGALPIGGGRSLIANESVSESLDFKVALPVLQQHLTDEQIIGCCKASKSSVEAAIKGTLPPKDRGRGKKWVGVLDELRAAGALVPEPRVRYEVTEPQLEGDSDDADGKAECAFTDGERGHAEAAD